MEKREQLVAYDLCHHGIRKPPVFVRLHVKEEEANVFKSLHFGKHVDKMHSR